MVDPGADPERVHPVPVHLLLSRLLDDVLQLLLGGVKAWMIVEQVGDKCKIELLVTLDNILGCHELPEDKTDEKFPPSNMISPSPAVNLLRLFEHVLRPLSEVIYTNTGLVDARVLRGNLVDEVYVHLAVFNIVSEVLYSAS